eukprot:GHVU01212376.1.p1 GENE.GHVU01212376.1~~GHVU01212376.1.p1  ORF type:complete len:339 (-),score=78.47 GHVU01212376.1:114-1130(-)
MAANGQLPMCGGLFFARSTTTQCRPQNELCTPSFFEFAGIDGEDGHGYAVSPLSNNSGVQFATSTPITLRVGDYDADGFPDLLAVVHYPGRPASALLLQSVPKEASTAAAAAAATTQPQEEEAASSSSAAPTQRLFQEASVFGLFGDSLERLRSSRGGSASQQSPAKPDSTVDVAAFFDVFEDGQLDILQFGTHWGSGWHPVGRRIASVSSRQEESDVLYLKAFSLNGVCPKACDPPGPRFPSPPPYGTSLHGATFKVTVTDLNGVKAPRIATQLSQSAHSPLQIPFAFFGLGRTNNYIEEFFLGIPSRHPSCSNLWVSIIPNTQIIAVPFPRTSPKQ